MADCGGKKITWWQKHAKVATSIVYAIYVFYFIWRSLLFCHSFSKMNTCKALKPYQYSTAMFSFCAFLYYIHIFLNSFLLLFLLFLVPDSRHCVVLSMINV